MPTKWMPFFVGLGVVNRFFTGLCRGVKHKYFEENLSCDFIIDASMGLVDLGLADRIVIEFY